MFARVIVSRALWLIGAIPLCAQLASAQAVDDWSVLARSRTRTPKPTSPAISAADLRTRLFQFADDSMGGRLLGTAGNVMGTDYIAREAKRFGLEPAGDNGTYFQTVPVMERSLDSTARIRVGEHPLVAWTDYVLRDQGAATRSIDGVAAVYAGVWGDSANLIPASAAEGKLVLLAARPDETPPGGTLGIPSRPAVLQRFARAAGIAVIALDRIPPAAFAAYKEPTSAVQDDSSTPSPAYLYITPAVARQILGADYAQLQSGAVGTPVSGNPRFTGSQMKFPARNVVGMLRGSDPTLRNEYVAIGAHNDHIGTVPVPAAHDSIYVFNHLFRTQGADSDRPTVDAAGVAKLNAILAAERKKTNGASARPDSISNGADDDGSGSVSVLELAEYFSSRHTRPKRSMLFVWHVGEEEGLWGSAYFTDHPTVPRDAIVAQLNIDMIGRGGASDITGSTKAGEPIHGSENYLQLVGSRRLSSELGDMIESVNRKKHTGLAFDYSLDADGHPQNIYCRSDHYSYARYGIPITFFTTGGHADYHQVTDEPQYIAYDHMARVVNLVRDVATELANLDHRVNVDKPKPDPNGRCQQ